jgi:hypothetical protein
MGERENLWKKKLFIEFELSSMQRYFFIIFCLVFWSISLSYAETYEEYQTRLQATCETDKQWAQNTTWGGDYVLPPLYPEIKKSSIEWAREKIINESNTPSERSKIEKDLDILEIRKSAFPTLDLVRVMYRSRMNQVFGCGVIRARENITKNLLKEIEKKYPSRNSEIQTKIQREWERLKIQKRDLGCRDQPIDQTPEVTRIINAATRQYCHYDTYLRYMRISLESDATKFFEVEKSLWRDPSDNKELSLTIGEFGWIFENKWEAISREIGKIQTLLPRALSTFQEMERTYEIHLLLVIIYDDYVRLRENLARYFDAVTQLMEKTKRPTSK